MKPGRLSKGEAEGPFRLVGARIAGATAEVNSIARACLDRYQ